MSDILAVPVAAMGFLSAANPTDMAANPTPRLFDFFAFCYGFANGHKGLGTAGKRGPEKRGLNHEKTWF
jgi:hypothetical protein